MFIGYAAFRIRNAIVTKRKLKTHKALNFCTSGATVLLCAVVIFSAAPKQECKLPVSTEKVPIESTSSVESSVSVISSTASSYSESKSDNSSSESSSFAESSSKTESSSAFSTVTEPIVVSEAPPISESVTENSSVPAVSVPEKTSRYIDGEYTASAYGYDGDITVTITIENDKITDIKAYSSEGDLWYFDSAADTVISQIISKQSSEVDAVTGATFSSKGIMAAVADALESAKRR